jgi:bacterioferritin-associated ferredoxin
MYICVCKSIKEIDLVQLIKEKKLKTLEEVQEYIDVANGCKVCEQAAIEILERVRNE